MYGYAFFPHGVSQWAVGNQQDVRLKTVPVKVLDQVKQRKFAAAKLRCVIDIKYFHFKNRKQGRGIPMGGPTLEQEISTTASFCHDDDFNTEATEGTESAEGRKQKEDDDFFYHEGTNESRIQNPGDRRQDNFLGLRRFFRGGDFLKCGGHLGDLGQLGDVVNNWGVADAG